MNWLSVIWCVGELICFLMFIPANVWIFFFYRLLALELYELLSWVFQLFFLPCCILLWTTYCPLLTFSSGLWVLCGSLRVVSLPLTLWLDYCLFLRWKFFLFWCTYNWTILVFSKLLPHLELPSCIVSGVCLQILTLMVVIPYPFY